METFSLFVQEKSRNITKIKNILFRNFIFKLLSDKFKSLNNYAVDFKEFFIKKECGIFFSFSSIIEKLSLLLNKSLKP